MNTEHKLGIRYALILVRIQKCRSSIYEGNPFFKSLLEQKCKPFYAFYIYIYIYIYEFPSSNETIIAGPFNHLFFFSNALESRASIYELNLTKNAQEALKPHN